MPNVISRRNRFAETGVLDVGELLRRVGHVV